MPLHSGEGWGYPFRPDLKSGQKAVSMRVHRHTEAVPVETKKRCYNVPSIICLISPERSATSRATSKVSLSAVVSLTILVGVGRDVGEIKAGVTAALTHLNHHAIGIRAGRNQRRTDVASLAYIPPENGVSTMAAGTDGAISVT